MLGILDKVTGKIDVASPEPGTPDKYRGRSHALRKPPARRFRLRCRCYSRQLRVRRRHWSKSARLVVPVANSPTILYESRELLKHKGKSYDVELVRFRELRGR